MLRTTKGSGGHAFDISNFDPHHSEVGMYLTSNLLVIIHQIKWSIDAPRTKVLKVFAFIQYEKM